MDQRIYKVCSRDEWRDAQALGRYEGSADDLRDGFIHFSLAHQLEATLCKHYAGRSDLLVLAFDPAMLGAQLRYEPSRGGDLFPHLYGSLTTSLALQVTALRWQEGSPVLHDRLEGVTESGEGAP